METVSINPSNKGATSFLLIRSPKPLVLILIGIFEFLSFIYLETSIIASSLSVGSPKPQNIISS